MRLLACLLTPDKQLSCATQAYERLAKKTCGVRADSGGFLVVSGVQDKCLGAGVPPPASTTLPWHAVSTRSSRSVSFSCSLYNNIKPPSWLPPGADFHLFKEGIQPKWEDPSCEHGGKWTILVPRGNKQILDKFWLHSVRPWYWPSLVAAMDRHIWRADAAAASSSCASVIGRVHAREQVLMLARSAPRSCWRASASSSPRGRRCAAWW